jgi:predicted nuclease of predicted toxin-antitoxin system
MTSKLPEAFSFLVDANLPKWFSFFNKKNFIHVVDINPRMKDDEIWEYAINHNMVILTKDTDFYSMSISVDLKPKIVCFQLGNMTLAELFHYFDLNWSTILNHLNEAELIIAERNRINVIL